MTLTETNNQNLNQGRFRSWQGKRHMQSGQVVGGWGRAVSLVFFKQLPLSTVLLLLCSFKS